MEKVVGLCGLNMGMAWTWHGIMGVMRGMDDMRYPFFPPDGKSP